MNRTALYIDGIETPMSTSLVMSVSYLIADVRYPDKRNSDFTKTLEIPSTSIIDEIFEFAFEVNISLTTFNPNLKKPIRYTINDATVLTGNIQLTRMRVNYETGLVVYVCNIKGQLTDLFYTIGDKFLTGNEDSADDLDFSTYDHVLDKNNVWGTWFPTIVPKVNRVAGVSTPIVAGIGYRYPLIDYGLNGGNLEDYYLHHQRPMLMLYEYLKKIFEMAGKTWTSTFLESTFFKTLGIPCTEIVTPTTATLEDLQVLAGLTGGPGDNNALTYSSGFWLGGAFQSFFIFDDDTNSPYHDDGSQYNTANGELNIGVTRPYVLTYGVNIRYDLTPPAGATTADGWEAVTEVNLIKVGVATVATTGVLTETVGPGIISYTTQQTVSFSGTMSAGDVFIVEVKTGVENCTFVDFVGGTAITTGSSNLNSNLVVDNPSIGSNSRISLTLISENIYEGDLLEVNQTIPKKIKQRDLLSSVVKAFKLNILPDKENVNNYFIEPHNDFYSTAYYDWTDKLDIGPDVEIIPLGELDVKQFKFKYKQADDVYNKSYQSSWIETYGEKTFESENQFVTGENVQELIFSPTPLVGNDINGLIIPKIYKQEGAVISLMRTNIRLLQWTGAVQISSGQWKQRYVNGSFDTIYTFPFAGHLDHPYTPTIDLNFSVPGQLFYRPENYTTNNLYTVYHKDSIGSLTNKNSKLVRAFFNLDEIDIKDFDFRKQVYFNGSFYLVNAIRNFNILESKSTEVELLKLLR